MRPEEMEKAMINNMVQKTGKTLDDWIKIIHAQNFDENSEIIHFLKTKYNIGHFYAHLITKKSNL